MTALNQDDELRACWEEMTTLRPQHASALHEDPTFDALLERLKGSALLRREKRAVRHRKRRVPQPGGDRDAGLA